MKEINLVLNNVKEGVNSGTLLMTSLIDYYNLNICRYEPLIE